ncbi:MAG: superoxide dismutase [Fe], partial [Acidimicrobiaceae bacterium]|nr:superoxide dismutase [Fe] [Acidimicrobiaceae bacterium]
MTIELAPLPYPLDGLAPHISERTMSFHYGRHHAGYVASVNSTIAGTAHENASLEDIVAAADVPSALFNCSAQAWN